MRILLVEDEKEVADFIQKGLEEVGHTVFHSGNGREALTISMDNSFDVMILDRMIPELDGLSLVKAIRATRNETPILLLSALGEVNERVNGLKAGGDDYLTKPFAFSELLARVEVLSKRPPLVNEKTNVLQVGVLELDLLSRQASRAGKNIPLHEKEFRLLEQLMRNKGRVMTRTMLLENVWGYQFDPQTNVIDVHMSNLRKKIDNGGEYPLLHTIRGAGYKIDEKGY